MRDEKSYTKYLVFDANARSERHHAARKESSLRSPHRGSLSQRSTQGREAPPIGTLTIGLPPREAVGQAVANVLEYAEAMAANHDTAPALAVHELRKSLRRVRAVLQLLRGALPDGVRLSMKEELARVLRATSALRDLHVLRGTLGHLAKKRSSIACAALDRLIASELARESNAQMPSRPGTGLKRLIPAIRDAWWLPSNAAGSRPNTSARAKPPLRTFASRLSARLSPELRFDMLVEAAKSSYHSTRRARKAARRSGDREQVHRWRKRLKELRYQLELLRSVLPRRATALLEASGKLAETLGEITDLYALSDYLEERARILGPDHAPTLRSEIEARIADRLQRAFKTSRRSLSGHKGCFKTRSNG